ncbi:MAG: dienelactone hydrolase family protein [Pseudonocardiaceae bacterium]
MHSSSFKLGRPLLNEVFYLHPHTVLDRIQAPMLIVHGTKDTFIPVDSSRWAATQLTVEHRLIEIHGAQHGFAVHNDPAYAEPQTQRWQACVVKSATAWVAASARTRIGSVHGPLWDAWASVSIRNPSRSSHAA